MKKAVILLLALTLTTSLWGCTPSKPAASADAKTPPAAGNTVVDGSGAVLTIPKNNTETTIASVYGVSVPFIVALGLSDRVKAINVKSSFWTDNVAALASAGSVGRGVVDLEALAKLSPGVLVHRANDPQTVNAVSALGIPVLSIKAENLDDIKGTLRMMGDYFGVSKRADAVVAWMDAKFNMIDSVVATIPRDKRVTALVMGGELGRVAGGDMLQSWMVEKAGGVCVTGGVKNNSSWADVGVETVFKWNPDFIFCTGSTSLDYTPEGLYQDASWSAVSAVQHRRVTRIPAAKDAWDLPGISCVLGTMYMLRQMYPDYFSADALQKQIDDYYTFMFGKTFSPDALGYDPKDSP